MSSTGMATLSLMRSYKAEQGEDLVCAALAVPTAGHVGGW